MVPSGGERSGIREPYRRRGGSDLDGLVARSVRSERRARPSRTFPARFLLPRRYRGDRVGSP